MPNPKVLFLLADGARARFVERSPETGRYVTIQEIDGREQLRSLRSRLRSSPPARAAQRSHAGRHRVGPQDDFRPAKEAFAAEIAERAAKLLQRRAYQGVFLAAPARLVGPLRRKLAGKVSITGQINRDLTQAADAELGRWLPLRPMRALLP